MDVSEITQIVLGTMIGIIAYFVKQVLTDVKELKNMDLKHELLKQRVESTEEKLDKHHASIGAQQVQNTKYEVMFAQIMEKLDQLIKANEDK